MRHSMYIRSYWAYCKVMRRKAAETNLSRFIVLSILLAAVATGIISIDARDGILLLFIGGIVIYLAVLASLHPARPQKTPETLGKPKRSQAKRTKKKDLFKQLDGWE